MPGDAPRIEPATEPAPLIEHLFVSKRFGRPLGTTATLARNPELLLAFDGLGLHFVRSGLVPAREREVIILRIAWRTRSIYEFGVHTILGKQAGLRDEEIRRIGSRLVEENWSEKDLALLKMTDEIWAEDFVSDSTWAQLEKEWVAAELIELVVMAGFYRLAGTFLNTMRVPQEAGVPGWPE